MTRVRSLTGLTLVILSLASSTQLAADVTTASRAVAPDFTLRDAKGAPVRLSTYKGKVVLLDFWATWCAGCKVEIPWYMEFQTRYKAKGLVALGVAMDDEGWQKVGPYLAEHPINYPIVVGDADAAKKYSVNSLPLTLLIDRDGKIAATHRGLVEKDAFESELRKLLSERAGKAPSPQKDRPR